MLTKVSDICIGDRIDLEGDAYADPDRSHIAFEFEYALVTGIERETPGCTCLYIEGVDAFGFPPDHMIEVASHDSDVVAE